MNGSWLLALSAWALRHELGVVWWLVAAFAFYGGAVLAGFVLYPYQIPYCIERLCFGDMEAELYALLWPATVELCPDEVDTTWRWPAVAAVVELLGFAGFL